MLLVELERNNASAALVEIGTHTAGLEALARLGLLPCLAMGTTNVTNVFALLARDRAPTVVATGILIHHPGNRRHLLQGSAQVDPLVVDSFRA